MKICSANSRLHASTHLAAPFAPLLLRAITRVLQSALLHLPDSRLFFVRGANAHLALLVHTTALHARGLTSSHLVQIGLTALEEKPECSSLERFLGREVRAN